ncbi:MULTISPECIES: stage II sporulation protein R [unclassified Clostridium]|uniref:stage II sporulation protein R n=1 Tax=unclassified Clostridium TaxID=2614128 RepID=UPI0018970A57|nr:MULTISPECIES: stage II sporulation protein R [unclassified Clostridium]MCR1951736.1 stage II sporulation protein R [Clostridium sp. DSM 100503]
MKKRVFIICLIFIIFSMTGCSGVVIGQGVEENHELIYDDIVNEIIRFHVIANSDSEEDQNLKLKVRDKVIEYVSDKLKDCKDLSEAREFIVSNKSEIELIAKNTVIENGYSYDVTSMLSRENFPDKVYGDLIFPQGEYEAYRILIGEAKGQNWWCVMFPPLCFVDGTKDAVDSKEIEEKLSEEKAKDENNIRSENENKNKKANIKFKSKIFEVLFKDKDK